MKYLNSIVIFGIEVDIVIEKETINGKKHEYISFETPGLESVYYADSLKKFMDLLIKNQTEEDRELQSIVNTKKI
jgi:hypothetical protein